MCDELGVEMLWGVGGNDKANSSSDLVERVLLAARFQIDRLYLLGVMAKEFKMKTLKLDLTYRPVGVIDCLEASGSVYCWKSNSS